MWGLFKSRSHIPEREYTRLVIHPDLSMDLYRGDKRPKHFIPQSVPAIVSAVRLLNPDDIDCHNAEVTNALRNSGLYG